uniref:PCI domain-containing protein n=1 Tax=Phaeomonas parva TaxID=124430 RepID=A0A7S1U9V7_9STRA|mmetsp:Transcript_3856/g.11155  ORF Transcript_3856/g.11155 Transcript_3856/m.11155 type:complete len:500 (+) Transcript_3856:213-1712(+)
MPEAEAAMDVVEEKKAEEAEEAEPAAPANPTATLVRSIVANVVLLGRAVEGSNVQLFERVLRLNTAIRRKSTKKVLGLALTSCVDSSDPLFEGFLNCVGKLPEPEEAAADEEEFALNPSEKPALDAAKVLPEVAVYIYNLVTSVLLREKLYDTAAEASAKVVEYMQRYNRRSLDIIGSKAYQNYSFAHEKAGAYGGIRSVLLRAHRTACLQHNEIGQAVLLNLILRNYLAFNAVDQAYKLVNKSTFPESVSNNQFCRYLYYVGRIEATQLDYGDAHLKLQQALRKAPTSAAAGFKLQTQKLEILVQLLMGDIPERSVFMQKGTRDRLASYFRLTQAVREGEIQRFHAVLAEEAAQFRADGNYVIAQRLAHNVIKIGLKRINLAYHRIHLQDIAKILHLGSVRAAEHVVCKAIRDGVIDASIDHESGVLQSALGLDVYSGDEPQTAYSRRINFCLDLYQESVKAMQYPADAYKSRQQKHKDDEIDEDELAKELAEAEMDE